MTEKPSASSSTASFTKNMLIAAFHMESGTAGYGQLLHTVP